MIDYTAIRTAIVSGLTAHLGVPVVMLAQDAPRPPYPFVGYRFTVPYGAEPGLPVETGEQVSSTDPDWEHDYRYRQQSQPMMTLSVTAYTEEPDASNALALAALEWFQFQGYQHLKDSGIIVLPGSTVQDRDIQLVDYYERRQGFDVILRVGSELTRTVPTIESVEIDQTVEV